MRVIVIVDMKNGDQIRETKTDLAAARAYARKCIETGVESNDVENYRPAANIKEINFENYRPAANIKEINFENYRPATNIKEINFEV